MFEFLASAALTAKSVLQSSRVSNKLKELDMTCEDNLVEEKKNARKRKKVHIVVLTGGSKY